jgi:hypothetical protein
MVDLSESFALSPEQQDTATRLEGLFGGAIANRYFDFSRDSSRPSSGHFAPMAALKLKMPAARHSSSALRSQAMQHAPLGACLAHEGRDARGRFRNPRMSRSGIGRFLTEFLVSCRQVDGVAAGRCAFQRSLWGAGKNARRTSWRPPWV